MSQIGEDVATFAKNLCEVNELSEDESSCSSSNYSGSPSLRPTDKPPCKRSKNVALMEGRDAEATAEDELPDPAEEAEEAEDDEEADDEETMSLRSVRSAGVESSISIQVDATGGGRAKPKEVAQMQDLPPQLKEFEHLFHLKNHQQAIPLLLPNDPTNPWAVMTPQTMEGRVFRPHRAMVFNVITELFQRDASFFKAWALPGSQYKVRAFAAASLLSALFAGMSMGIPTGKNHEENQRLSAHAKDTPKAGKKSNKSGDEEPEEAEADSKQVKQVERYTFLPKDGADDSFPSYQIGLEEVYDSSQSEVIALRVWLFINDECHSTSDLLHKVMRQAKGLHDASRGMGSLAYLRDRALSAEQTRQERSGAGPCALDVNFESTVGLQWKRFTDTDQYKAALDIHAGRVTGSKGRPCIDKLVDWTHTSRGRRAFAGSTSNECGCCHPAAPEYLLNAKRTESLAFGLVALDGTLLDVNPAQIDPSLYWSDTGEFSPPEMQQHNFWLSTSPYKRSIFDLPIVRPLQGSIIPGVQLMKLFLRNQLYESRQRDGLAPPTEAEYEAHSSELSTFHYNQLRTLMTEKDELVKQQEELLRNSIGPHDMLNGAGGVTIFRDNAQDAETPEFTLKTISMTSRVALETDRLYTKVFNPFIMRSKRDLQAILSRANNATDEESAQALLDEWRDATAKYRQRLFLAKKDLVQYHARLTKACFLSKRDQATLPAGYMAMYKGLQDGVAERDGTASMAFHGQGVQLMDNDRSVFASLQAFLGQVFVADCKIDGRDRKHMDELYLSVHEIFHEVTFILIFASEKGKGKSIRATRMAAILPKGMCTFNSANSARSGMNGNNSPSNGTVVFSDEMLPDLVKAECDERMEYFKTILCKREFEIERTRNVKQADGSDSHVTYKIVTEHREVYVICCNLGQCFTTGAEEPSPGKEALIQRTICLQVRAETTKDSPDDVFKAHLKTQEVSRRISDFRLFTSLVQFGLLLIQDLPWLQPDLAYAERVWTLADEMLTKEHGLPQPEPRRLVRRKNNLKTFCMQEAVAKVYFFKQSAVHHAVGSLVNGKPKAFEVGDFWEVLRILHPTPEMILYAWSHSLEYSVGTSCHGVGVSTAICEKLNVKLDNLFRREPSDSLVALSARGELEHELEPLGKRQRVEDDPSAPLVSENGFCKKELSTLCTQMANKRILRHDWRRRATSDGEMRTPLQSIREFAPDADETCEYADALMPSLVWTSMHYKAKVLLRWCNGMPVERSVLANSIADDGTPLPSDSTMGGAKTIFRERNTTAGAKNYDYAWYVISDGLSRDGKKSWRAAANDIKNCNNSLLFSYHSQGIADCLFMLASSENKRILAQTAVLPQHFHAKNAFVDSAGNAFDAEASHIRPRPIVPHQQFGCRPEERYAVARGVPVQREVDRLVEHGRLPIVTPMVSPNIIQSAPLRWNDGQPLEANAVFIFEHMTELMEAIVYCSNLPGLSGRTERFPPNAIPPAGLFVNTNATSDVFAQLPYSVDIMQIFWTSLFANRFYSSKRGEALASFQRQRARFGPQPPFGIENLPEFSIKYSGYQGAIAGEGEQLALLSFPLKGARPVGQKYVDVASYDDASYDQESLIRACERAIRRPATPEDMENYLKEKQGQNYLLGLRGDVFDFDTYQRHAILSMAERGHTVLDLCPEAGGSDDELQYLDPALNVLLASETMLVYRITELKSLYGVNDFYKNTQIGHLGTSTYANEERAKKQFRHISDVSRSKKRQVSAVNIQESDLLENNKMRKKRPGLPSPDLAKAFVNV